MRHHLLLFGAAGAAAALVVATHQGGPAPGRVLDAPPTARAAVAPPAGSPGLEGSVPQASPPPVARPLGPLTGLFSELNRDVSRGAAGQYALLQQIAGALRGWIDQLLHVPGRH